MPGMLNTDKGFSILFVLRFAYLVFRFSSHAASAAVEDVTNKSSMTKVGQKYIIALSHIAKHMGQENGLCLNSLYLSSIRKTPNHIQEQSIAVIGMSIIILLFLLL